MSKHKLSVIDNEPDMLLWRILTNMEKIKSLNRQDFPCLSHTINSKKIVYLDNAASALKPIVIRDVISEYYSGLTANVHRGKHMGTESNSLRYESARKNVATFLGSKTNEIIFTKNTSDGINIVANGLQLNKNDLVLVLDDSHHSNLLPWMNKCQLKKIPLKSDGSVDLIQFAKLVSLKPKVVSLTHCSNVTGVYIELEIMCDVAKKAGAIVLVDAAQSIPHRKINVSNLNIDFLVFSGHKMLAPTGIGVLYGRANALDKLDSTVFGGGAVDWVDNDSFVLRKIPYKFEVGTPFIEGAIALSAAIDYLNQIGFDKISNHDKELGLQMRNEVTSRDYLKPLTENSNCEKGAITSFSLNGINNLDQIAQTLSDSYGMLVRSGYLCSQPYITANAGKQVLRISGYFYNNSEEINSFYEALDEIYSFIRM